MEPILVLFFFLAMGTIFYFLFKLALCFSLSLLPPVKSVSSRILRFESNASNIRYHGHAVPSFEFVEMNHVDNSYDVGWATYAETVPLWESNTGIVSNFTTHFSFVINTQDYSGEGMAFFLAPAGIEIPRKSAGAFLGLYNRSTNGSPNNQIFHVEFDCSPNPWDPYVAHVGINNNSFYSPVYSPWNCTLHSGDIGNVRIVYNSTSKNLTVSWSHERTSNSQESTNLSYAIDMSEVLPERVKVGISAATSETTQQHRLLSWEFSSSFVLKRTSGKKAKDLSLILGVAVSIGVFIAGSIIAFAALWWHRQKKRQPTDMNLTSINDELERGVGPRRFTHKELAAVTNNFSNDRKLGEGGFGAVYEGCLADSNMLIAVKKISRGSKQGKREYITEVKILSQLRHRNLVQLIGWCHDKGEFLLVYNFMPNGSLDTHLFGKRRPLAWALRYKISLGSASALLYLHEEWEQCVVHRDIKSSNVMLDSNFNAKLGDFGLAFLKDHELGPQSTGLAGTLGYMAPEYIGTGKASKESDVYSFGVVLLEIATGRRSVVPMEDGCAIELVHWVWNLYGSGNLPFAMDEKLQQDFDEKQVECLMVVGLWCAHPNQTLRPSIRQAIHVLNFEATMPMLPSQMPIPMDRVPKLAISSGAHSITSSLQQGR